MLRIFKRFAKARSGLAAVEFALIAPVMGVLLIGTIDVCNALACRNKVTMLAATGADLVAQVKTVATSDVSDVFDAMNAIIYPFPGRPKVVITSILSDGNGEGTVDWSQAQDDTALTHGATVTLPSGLMPKDQCAADACSVILAQVSYDYSSPMGHFILGTVTMTDTFYAKPRRSAEVTCTDCTS